MSRNDPTEPYEIIWLVRRLFRALSQKSAEQLVTFGISVAERAVMEFLYPKEALSVPEIAERYQVSRQHIQVTVNSLLEQGLAVSRQNPRHKRSSLIQLNAKGRGLFETVLKQDRKIVDALFCDISKTNVRITRQTLQALLDALT